MIVYNEETEYMWCPFSRREPAYPGESAGYNRLESGARAKGTNCLGSACMAWVEDPQDGSRGRCGLSSGFWSA